MNKNSTLQKYTGSKFTAAFFALLMLCCTAISTQAQVTYNENFATGGVYPNNSLPLGWSQGKVGAGVDVNNRWDRMGGNTTPTATITTAPVCPPRSFFTTSPTLWSFNQPANSYIITLSNAVAVAPGVTVGSPVYIDFPSTNPPDGTYIVGSTAATSFTVTANATNATAVTGTSNARYFYDSILRYWADTITAGEAAFVASKKLDMSGWTAGAVPMSFYYYRNPGFGFTYTKVGGSPTVTITVAGGHTGLVPGSVVNLNFISGSITGSGTYTVVSVTSPTIFTISHANTAASQGTAAPGTLRFEEKIQVFLNDVPDADGATTPILLTETTTSQTTLFRDCGLTPLAGVCASSNINYSSLTAGWNQYTYDLGPHIAGIPTIDRDNLYVVIVATSARGHNVYIDDFSVQTWPNAMAVDTAYVFLQNSQTTAPSATTQDIIGGKVVTTKAGGPQVITSLVFNTVGSTNPTNDIAAAKLYYTAGTPLFNASNAVLLGVIPNPTSTILTFSTAPAVAGAAAQFPNGGAALPLENGDNHFWIAYDIKSTATSGNCVDAEWASWVYGFQKTGVNGTNGTTVLTLTSAADNIYLTPGMLVQAAGVPTGTTITSIVGATVNISAALTAGVVAGNVIFTPLTGGLLKSVNPFGLDGCREIDQIYCVGVMSAGTSWAGYTSNDYVRLYRFDGESGTYAGIYTGQKASTTPVGWPNPTTYNNPAPNAGDCDGTPFSTSNCPFTSHPPDYEFFTPSIPNRTTTTVEFNTRYVMHTYAGTWGSSNYLAGWIDFNKSGGAFNDTLFMATNVCGNAISNAPDQGLNREITGSTTVGSNVITITLPVGHQVYVNRTRVYGSHIPGGAIVTAVAGATVTMNMAAAVSATDTVYFINATGEKLFQSCGLGGQTDAIAAIYIPDDLPNIIASNLRLRIREVYAVSAITSCGGWTWGETEDYTITLKPACVASAFGAPTSYTRIWLGVADDDWSNPVNWCGGVPTVGDNAAIPDPSYLTAGAFSPVIKNGVLATAKSLWIGPNQSVTARGAANSSITIADSIHISAATSRLRVISSEVDTIQVSNGNAANDHNFWRGGNVGTDNTYKKARALYLYKPADFISRGMIAKDQITKILFNIERVNLPAAGNLATTGYTNVIVKMYYCSPAFGQFAVVPFTTLPVPIGVPQVVYTGNITDNIGKAAGTIYQRILNLSTPFAWDGSTNFVVVDISYDNGVGLAPTGVDYVRSTPTVLFRGYVVMYPNALTASAAETFTPGAANITTEVANQRRPNITFEFNRPYQYKYPIEVARNWHNNGVFDGGTYLYRNLTVISPAKARVSFTGVTDGAILGSTPTQFHHLRVLKANATLGVRRYTNFSVDDTLDLMRGRLYLNGSSTYPNSLVTVSNATNTAVIISRTDSTASALYPGGYLESESTVPPYGNIRWNIGSTPGTYRFPFVQTVLAGGNFVPFEYQLVSGTADITAATYKTPASNLPLPLAQTVPLPTYDDVTHLLGQYTGTPNDANTVDRFWMVNNASSGTAHLKFRFASNEEPMPSVAPYRAQRWDPNGILFPGSGGWEAPAPGQSYASFTVVDSSLVNYSNVWTLAGQSTPLPVELLEFTAVPVKDQVRINWTTASEFNNDYFEIERSVNQSDFTFIDRVKSKGASVNTQKYETFDMQPLQGIQYYWLRQYDYDGTLMSYGPVPVNFGKDRFEIVTALITTNQQGITVVFDYDSSEPYNYLIIDMLGQVVTSQGNNKAVKGVNVIDIPVDMSSGIYQIVLQNSTKTVSRKIMY
jgi:hypothetical protein